MARSFERERERYREYKRHWDSLRAVVELQANVGMERRPNPYELRLYAEERAWWLSEWEAIGAGVLALFGQDAPSGQLLGRIERCFRPESLLETATELLAQPPVGEHLNAGSEFFAMWDRRLREAERTSPGVLARVSTLLGDVADWIAARLRRLVS